ncbi:peptidoglycan recognition protein family protein [Amycolatopsis regifaucium]|uniref:N-acetylmuramoyl-L-alanine amidase n=1 Tax=Amycolatopsis regifaucium TaxID=546365 RepID=A0A154MH72_9PSEU|nr:N-acetylmuramoyl-L-alanine amidase [Amycolatopsis regifaucium]KZB83377.1 negative regulator of beta-lactamase [Amycolatopsis regifaucium]OKA08842.1 N-acetylmuramoyl-L-alanine amidase [Amycolatopsis regifaucium]SFI92488.1 Putative peptidoglycan binding domain-containing protein [Amycolatopsis regifaucium]
MADFDRRTALKGGLTVSAVGLLGTATTSAASAAAGIPEPQIYGTAAWGARPPNGTIEVQNHKPTYIVVHHTVDPGNVTDYTLEHAFWASRAIQNFHMDTRGWVDSGQQFTNSRGGHITEGRHRSLEVLRGGTRHVLGANVGNHNSTCIGIENEGLYSKEDVPPALWNSLVKMVAYIASQYGIAPEFIKGHRDFNSTECPGTVLYNRLPELRTAVGRLLGSASPKVDVPEWPLLKPGDSGPRVRTAQELLRARGFAVPVDGVFGQSTKDAVAAVAARHGLERDGCGATAATDETGFLGSDVWPLLTRPGTDPRALKARLAG